jgi:Xaa-Pro aminopeptidase
MRYPHRVERLRELMAKPQTPIKEGEEAAPPVDALVVSHLENARYLTGFSGSNALAVVTQYEAVFLTDSRYAIQAAAEVPGWEQVILPPGAIMSDAAVGVLRDLDLPPRIGFEADQLTVSAYEAIRKALGDGAAASLVPRMGLVEGVRQVKDAEEIVAIRRAVAVADACFDHVRAVARPGMTELALAWEMEKFMRERGASRLAFDTIAGSGPNSALIHGHPTDRVLGASGEPELLLCDWGCVVDGYCSDITRTLVVGGEPDARQRDLYSLVLHVQLACLDAIRPGVLGKAVDALARDLFGQAGFGEAFAHSLGHSFGRYIHEPPQLGKRGETPLEPGMVLTVEPGVYLEGFGGVRIEDAVLVTETGCEVLTQSPKELLVL